MIFYYERDSNINFSLSLSPSGVHWKSLSSSKTGRSFIQKPNLYVVIVFWNFVVHKKLQSREFVWKKIRFGHLSWLRLYYNRFAFFPPRWCVLIKHALSNMVKVFMTQCERTRDNHHKMWKFFNALLSVKRRDLRIFLDSRAHKCEKKLQSSRLL